MLQVIRFLWITVFLVACASCATGGSERCRQSVPTDAGINLNHGEFFFIVPRIIPNAYSGAQEMWSESGQLIWRLEFNHGQIARLQMFDAGEESLNCDYSKATDPAHEDCPSRQQLSSGLPTIQAGNEPVIPADRDLRGKCVAPFKI